MRCNTPSESCFAGGAYGRLIARAAAFLCYLFWVALVVVSRLRLHGYHHRPVPWAAAGQPLPFTLSLAALFFMLASWLVSFWVWSKGRRHTAIRVVELVVLILFGFFISAFYINLATRHLSPRVSG